MHNAVLLITLLLALPSWAANPPCTPVKKRPASPCCRCPSDPAIPLLTEQIGHLQQAVPGLTAAVTSLATATHNVSQAMTKPPPTPAPLAPFSRSDWLTLMAIIIALSAYMASLRWLLIDKYGRAKRKLCHLKSLPEDEMRARRIAQLTEDMQKHQQKIRAISWVDFTLAFPLFAIVYILFAPYLCQPAFSAPFIATLTFVVALLLLLRRHIREWKKTFNTWRKPEVICK